MSDDLKFFGGLGVGIGVGALGYALLADRADDDRPPIIVRGGSLVFQSGAGNFRGKPWLKHAAKKHWQMKHPGGKPTRGFFVVICAGSGMCDPGFVESVSFEYESGTTTTTFELVTRADDGFLKGRPAPTIIGARWEELKADNSPKSGTPTLTFDVAGQLTRVVAGTVIDCRSPGTIYILPLSHGA